nr:oligosaccharide repeat unit polymerase [Bacilli bacterium]
MSIIATLVSLILLFFAAHKRKNALLIPLVVFLLLWTVILFLSCFNLYGMHPASNEAYTLIMIMEASFFLGYKIVEWSKDTSSRFNDKYVKHLEFSSIYFYIIYIIGFVTIIFNIVDLILVLKQYSAGIPMWQIRNWSLQPFGSENPILSRRSFIEETIRTVLCSPFTTLIHPISCYYLFNGDNKKRKIMLMLISIIIIATGSLAGGGGRLVFIYYLMCLYFSYKVSKITSENEIKKNSKKYKRIFKFAIFVSITSILVYTGIRTGISNTFKQVYTYLAMPPTLLSQWLPLLKVSTHTHGYLSFFGTHSYLFRFLKMANIGIVPSVYDLSYQYIIQAENFLNIGSGVSNAFVTPIYYFYLDGGYLFVILASAFFGIIISYFYTNFRKQINIKSFAIYLLIMYGILVSFARIQTAIPAYIISFILVYAIFYKKKKNR